ncbi:MAG: hypothetical protein IPO28_15230 [Holophagaceae bacterium]|nr:hypothetical protein [Holophagaceae bacterium]
MAFTATQILTSRAAKYRRAGGKLIPRASPSSTSPSWWTSLQKLKPDVAVFSYSDVLHTTVMHLASLCIAHDVDFELLGADKTMIQAKVPVIAITAVRQARGQEPDHPLHSNILKSSASKVVAIRHSMPLRRPRQAGLPALRGIC